MPQSQFQSSLSCVSPPPLFLPTLPFAQKSQINYKVEARQRLQNAEATRNNTFFATHRRCDFHYDTPFIPPPTIWMIQLSPQPRPTSRINLYSPYLPASTPSQPPGPCMPLLGNSAQHTFSNFSPDPCGPTPVCPTSRSFIRRGACFVTTKHRAVELFLTLFSFS